ncbi:MAG: DUF1080 domain-containing protein [Lentisphaerae bacterium]|nr:DUF1080 domain-containing protein [Lentisphaerota bacterium]
MAALASELVWAKPADGGRILEVLMARGAPALRELVAGLRVPGQGEDAGVRSALHGLALRVGDGAHEAQRAMLAGVLLEALASPGDAELLSFVIAQLQLVGRDEAVPALAARLSDARLGDPAVRALCQIGTPAARAALRQALAGAPPGVALPLVHALGSLRDVEAIPAIVAHLGAADPSIRQAALLASADCGAAAASEAILAAASSADPTERRLGIRAAVLLAQRLHAAGRPAEALALQKALAGLPEGALPALSLRVDLLGVGALDDLIAAAAGADVPRREMALRLGQALPGQAVTAAWCAALPRMEPPAARAALVAMLGRRQDRAALPVLRQMLADADAGVRAAAMKAFVHGAPDVAMTPLVDIVATGSAEDVAAGRALLTWAGGAELPSAAAAALGKATPAGKAALLELLASRQASEQAPAVLALLGDGEASVRLAVLKTLETLGSADEVPAVLEFTLATQAAAERRAAQRALTAICRRQPAAAAPVVAALKAASGEARVGLLGLAATLGGAEALAVVVADTASPDEAVRLAAVKALGEWPDDAAAAPLIGLARGTADPRTRVLALRGYVRAVTLPTRRPAAETAALLGQAWALAATADERRLVLSGLGTVRDDAALASIVKGLDLEDVREEAAAAVVAVCCPRTDKDPGLLSPAAYAALVRVRDASQTPALVERARAHLEAFPVVGGANLALGKPVTTSCAQQGDKAPSRAIDGKITRQDAWFGAAWPSRLEVDLQQEVSIEAVRVVFYWDGRRSYQYRVEASLDGQSWVVVADNSANTRVATEQGVVHRFKAVRARHVRLAILKNSVNEAVHVVELEVYAAGQVPAVFATGEPAAPPVAKAPPIQAPPLPEADAEGFISLFNGKDLTGWMGSTQGYGVEDGILVCKEKGGGMLLTMHRFSDFVLRFDVRMPKGANNGLAIRSPARGNPAYAGMELQIIDNEGYKEAHGYELKPWQTHGSIYGCVPARTGALKPCGEWNQQEVRAVGGRITVIVNGQTIVDADVDALTETADGQGLAKHPGLRRRTGHLGWLGHGARVEFRNIRIRPLPPYSAGPHNVPPEGFTALFNGKDLAGWKGLVKVDNPEKRAALPAEELRRLQEEADAVMRAGWTVEDGTLVFSGKGRSLCTARDYADVELYVDWKIKPGGDSGIYLRGSPQVQIWDTARWPQGSGGLYNNKKNPSDPSECADNPVGEWNRFFIRMVGEKVTVVLNGVTVVDQVVMENYWNRALPIFPSGQIELQNHGNTLWFRNIFVRELPAARP